MKLKDEEKRIRIKNETINIIFEKGFAGVKMAELARKVGISPSTLYVYYKNKEDLIVSICSELIKEQMKKSKQNMNENLSFKLQLKSIWLHWVNFGINNHKEMSFLTQVKQSPYYQKVPQDIRDDKMKAGIGLIEMGKEAKELKNIDTGIILGIIDAMLKQTIFFVTSKQLSIKEKDLNMMFDITWNAIKH
ncbi:TetR/AcrR family transcriptional regulator [Aureivirga sp. CE67]|uniref:TetR/AcrR family transcriptional regulator n=1 Tax=Aureivirga sp. CE67 TaxID=1788983 RepID=UPI0018C8DA28|nr:TetR/AcrR family transcriptional regulator [Aureivirga sp. CE67]